MGLLDDAIREHLDLKRRRGADPSDIERAEREALGPVRRDPFEHGPHDSESAVINDDGPRAYDHEEEFFDDEGYEEYGTEEEWEEDFEEQPGEPYFAPEDTAGAEDGELAGPSTIMDNEYLEEPQPPIAEEPPASQSYPQGPGAGDETMQYDVEEALASEHSQAEASPEWVEQSDEWVEQSEEWDEPPHIPAEPPEPHADEVEEYAPGVEPAPPHDPEADHAAEGREDVFEETPESLQDAPDRDQLWFEQRPRDSDFDG